MPTERSPLQGLSSLLGIDLWSVRSFAADVRIHFDEHGNVLRTELLNPNTPPAATPCRHKRHATPPSSRLGWADDIAQWEPCTAASALAQEDRPGGGY